MALFNTARRRILTLLSSNLALASGGATAFGSAATQENRSGKQPATSPSLSQATIGLGLYPQTAAEVSAGVMPTYYFYPPLNILRYGASGNGTTDDTGAIQAAVKVAGVTGGTVVLPAGNYKISSVISNTANNVNIDGAGEDATKITMSSNTQQGILIGNKSAVTVNCFVRNLTVASSSTQIGGSAIEIMNAGNCGIEHVRFGPGLNWAIDLDAATPSGVGGYSYYLKDLEINSCVKGIVLGLTSFVQDVFANNVVIDGASGEGVLFISASGIYMDAVSTASCGTGFETLPGASQNVNAVFFSRCLSDTTLGNAWNFITNGGKVVEVVMVDCWGCGAGNASHGSAAAAGVHINQSSGTINGVKIHGGIFHHNLAAGINVVAASNVMVDGAQIYQNSFAGSARHSGIEINAGVSNFVLSNNICGPGGYFDVVNVLPNWQAYGIAIAAGASNNYAIHGNLVTGNLTAGIGDGGTGLAKIVNNNPGYNPIGDTAISVTASPFTWTNKTGAPASVFFTGGTISSITVNGLGGAATAAANPIVVPAGAPLVVTYSGGAPAMTFQGF